MADAKLKYLEMIQGVINRMASNQVQLRTWGITLCTAIIGYVAGKDNHPKAAFLGSVPAITFWVLDGYYLSLEKKFRDLFDEARKRTEGAIEFQMSVGRPNFDQWRTACLQPAVWLVYVPVLLISLGIGVWAMLE